MNLFLYISHLIREVHTLQLILYHSRISFLHRAVCFEITLYISSHFSYSCAAFRKIAQAGGGGQGQGELWFHGVVRCCLF